MLPSLWEFSGSIAYLQYPNQVIIIVSPAFSSCDDVTQSETIPCPV
jgi:hypothetical protein